MNNENMKTVTVYGDSHCVAAYDKPDVIIDFLNDLIAKVPEEYRANAHLSIVTPEHGSLDAEITYKRPMTPDEIREANKYRRSRMNIMKSEDDRKIEEILARRASNYQNV